MEGGLRSYGCEIGEISKVKGFEFGDFMTSATVSSDGGAVVVGRRGEVDGR